MDHSKFVHDKLISHREKCHKVNVWKNLPSICIPFSNKYSKSLAEPLLSPGLMSIGINPSIWPKWDERDENLIAEFEKVIWKLR